MDNPFFKIIPVHLSYEPFDIQPIAGYEFPINKETGKHFPYCCEFHQAILKDAQSWFKNFPDCCEDHKQMSQNALFQKSKYNGIPLKIVTQVAFTEHHIVNHIERSDWYKEITDFIEYNIISFGQPSIGLHIYLAKIKVYIEISPYTFTQAKKLKLIEFINGYNNKTEIPKTDFNILFSIYQEWLKVFPFELKSYFGNLEEHFENQMPFLNGKIEVNTYTGIAKAPLHTKSSLFDALINLTDNLLKQINGVSLYEAGLIPDAKKIQVDLLVQERKLELTRGYKNSSPDKNHRYIKMLKSWLHDEQKFWKKLTPIIDMETPHKKYSLTDPLWFLNEAKQELYYNLTCGGYSIERADEIFLFITNLINKLKEIRKIEKNQSKLDSIIGDLEVKNE